MTFRSIVAIGSLLIADGASAADAGAPVAFPMERYTGMSEKSPFALATPATVSTAPQASFAANWFVGGIARLGDVDFVTIKSRDLTTQFSLFGRESVDGVSLASVNWSDVIGQTTVILRKGTETAKLEFNESQLRGSSTGAAPAATTSLPTAMPPRITSNGGGSIITSGPAGQPALAEQNGMAASALNQTATAQQQMPASVQRRIRIINQPR